MILQKFSWSVVLCIFICSCSTPGKVFETQVVESQPIYESEKELDYVTEGDVAYEDFLSDMPVYEVNMLKNNPIEGIQIWDPLETVNRALFKGNDFVIRWVVTPLGTVYGYIVPRVIQKRISNVADNINMPTKLVNNLLQFKFVHASSVVSRFLLNSTIGVAGIFDFADYTGVGFLKKPPVQGLGKTLAHWGLPPGPFLMLPLLGPSDVRGGVGLIGDNVTNVFTYYLPEVGWVLRANDIFYLTVPLYYTATDGAADPYTNLRDLSSLQVRGAVEIEEHTPEQEAKKVIRPQDAGILETLGFLKYEATRDFEFAGKAIKGGLRFSDQEQDINYNVWMQENEAPLAFVIPGFGGDYDSGFCTKTAQDFYEKGFSVVTMSSIFSVNFAQGFKNNSKPGIIARDTEHIYTMLETILRTLRKEYPQKITQITLVGYSMGGFYTAFIAAKEEKLRNPIFDNYVSVHSPGNLTYAMSLIDRFTYDSYQDLSKEERTSRQLKSIGSIVERISGGPNPWNTPYQLTGEDARFLVGFSYIRSLLVWTEGLPIASFSSYCRNLIIPSYQKRVGLSDSNIVEAFGYNNSYWKIKNTLKNNHKLHLFVNKNDPLVDKQSLLLIKKLVPENRLSLSNRGGHLGNLLQIQEKVIRAAKRPRVKLR
ncbi:alpha/beta fold hydrolase [Candidatus Uabimicrobium sp. HlEnr_7]|uniref:alpha/beta fold hydrolase n=1 Tax=Candidatus Uabimicrobium helgolandensis TaxID=3095367 RepID=UPI003557492A